MIGTTVRPDVAIIYDWENNWAQIDAQGPRHGDKGYLDDCKHHYRAFWKRGIPADVIDMEQDFSSYKLLIAPMLYMVRPGVAERIEAFVQGRRHVRHHLPERHRGRERPLLLGRLAGTPAKNARHLV